MTTAWDKFQEMMRKEMLKIYSENMVEHSLNPRNLGHIDSADGFARITGPCGDTMSIWLRVEDDTITQATFATDGCGTTVASGSMITEMVKGKAPAEAEHIEQQDVLDALGGLPEESEHCALLASNTLKEAVKNYREKKRESAG